MPLTPSAFLRSCFLAGVDAVTPEQLFSPGALAPVIGTRPVAVLAIGKAAGRTAAAIHAALGVLNRPPVATFTIGHGQAGEDLSGDHPIPGPASRRAAAALSSWIDTLPLDVEVHVAISGGTSALLAAPRAPLEVEEVEWLFARLLRAGIDITEMNQVRKRVTQWSAGRLGAALAPRRVVGWVISDVSGDDPADVGSGPLSPDPMTSREIRARLEARGLWAELSTSLRDAVATETLKPEDPSLAGVELHLVARNADALAAAGRFALRHGVRAHATAPMLLGDAAAAGARIADDLIGSFRRSETSIVLAPTIPDLWIYGGECVVALEATSPRGGRNQELALAAAQRLALGDAGSGTTLLSAGTDGRDGTTDVAGAIVDGDTWDRIRASGRDPVADLAAHDAHGALTVVGATWATGATGTNVMDMVLALRSRDLISDAPG